jgi:hypothetical protein
MFHKFLYHWLVFVSPGTVNSKVSWYILFMFTKFWQEDEVGN